MTDITQSENFKVISGETGHERFGDQFRSFLRAQQISQREALLHRSELKPLPPELEEFVREAEVIFREEYARLGIRDIPPQEDIFLAPLDFIKQNTPQNYADKMGYTETLARVIVIWDSEVPDINKASQEEKELIFILQSMVLFHEMYHGKAKRFYRSASTEGGIEIVSWRNGLNYVDGSALEEGLAAKWGEKFEDLAKRLFPRGSSLYDRFKAGGPREYPNSLDLTNYLIAEVPNYLALAEKARIEGSVGDLAVAVEDRFGVGSFSTLIETNEAHAAVVLKELKTVSHPS